MNRIFKILVAVALFSVFSSPFYVSYAQDAEYNLIRRTYKVNTDGTMDISFRKEIKLLRNRAITAYADKGETFILYNPATDRLTINESYTIRKDGSRVQTPQNAFIDQLPSQCTDCGRYNGIRERVVVHTALEYDCIIVLDYTIHRQGSYLDEALVLAEDCPVKKYEVIVDLPKDSEQSIGYTVAHGDFKIKTLKDKHSFHQIATDLPQKYIDNYLPAAETLYPTVHISCGKRPSDLAESSAEKLPEAIYTVGELHDNDQLTYATNIRDYVLDNIHTTDFPLSLVGYKRSSAKETFLSGCGTPADKKRLVAAMLREAGFGAEEYDNGVHVTVHEDGRPMTYNLSTDSKRPARLDGAAIDEQRTIEISRDLIWDGPRVGGSYKQMTLPTENGSISIDPAFLTSVRKAPLKVRNCNEKYHYTIALPRTPKHTLVKPVDISRTEKGIGTIRISIKQLPTGQIDVVRELSIDVKDGIVTPKQYKAFRRMMQDWKTYKTVTIRAEKGKPIIGN